MGLIHKEFDINNKWDRLMITSYRKDEEYLEEYFKKHPPNDDDDPEPTLRYTLLISWNQLVTFYLEMVNDKY